MATPSTPPLVALMIAPPETRRGPVQALFFLWRPSGVHNVHTYSLHCPPTYILSTEFDGNIFLIISVTFPCSGLQGSWGPPKMKRDNVLLPASESAGMQRILSHDILT